MIFDDILDSWDEFGRVAGHSKLTRGRRAWTVRRFRDAGNDPINAIPQAVTGWLAGLDLKPASRRTYRAALVSWFDYLTSHKLISESPMRAVPVPHVPRNHPRPLGHEQLTQILATVDNLRSRRTHTYILCGWLAGLRVHEIAKIRGEHIDGDTLFVQGKGGTTAAVPLHPRLVEVARDMPKVGWWFPGRSDDQPHVHPDTVGLAIRRAMRRAGVDATPHQLRHTYATAIYRSTGDIAVTSKALRHACIQTTMIYAAVDVDRVRDAIQHLPDLAA